MSIAAGARLEHYEILAPLGAGGMGEVYRARDTRLNREVAIKILPVSFANDADRLRRFEVEALATSALNHPNILTIHGFGTAPANLGGAPYIVAELLQGAELRSQLTLQQGGPLPIRVVIDYARQIAAGLAAAHEKGIIHRDLKPENLFVTNDGRVKILDFGLAKLKPPRTADSDTNVSTRKQITDPGTVMGTAGYMSPEQVRGQDADHRADIFSFGAILYEMLSGQRAFDGDSSIEVMNSILKHDPVELTTINNRVPQGLERLVSRCLDKRPEHRFHSAHDLGYALEALSTSSGPRLETQGPMSTTTRSGRWSHVFGNAWAAWAVAALLLLVTIGATWAYFTHPSVSDTRVMKFSVLPPDKASFAQLSLSPDGRYLAFTALTTGRSQLWVRAMDTLEAKQLPGTQDALFPFWSPDSRFIGFFANGTIKKIELSGGPIQTICEASVPLGAAWSRDGVILFGQWPSGLARVSATGGAVTTVTAADASRQEFSHHFPTFLPDGNFVFTISSEAKETRGIYVGSLDGKIKRRLIDDGHNVKYMPAVPGDMTSSAGWLLYGRDGALLAQPFDARRLELTGEPFSLSDKLASDINSPNYYTFSVSDNGMLIFDSNPNRKRRQYEWVDRRSQHFDALGLEAGIFQLWLSPDDKRFVADQIDPQIGTYDLWLHDALGGNATRFTFDPQHDFSPIWSPDGTRIVWSCSHQGIADLYQKASSLDGEQTVLLKTDYSKFPTDWSHDGQFIIYSQMDPKTKSDVWAMPTTNGGTANPFPVARSEANEGSGTLSPDGHWLAYTSDASGRDEIYVQRFPGGGGKRQISTGGGGSPRWRQDGRELFYYGADGRLMAVPVKQGEGLELGTAVPLFTFRAGAVPGFLTFAVTSDGQRFLINAIVEAEPNAPLTVVVNWPSQVKK